MFGKAHGSDRAKGNRGRDPALHRGVMGARGGHSSANSPSHTGCESRPRSYHSAGPPRAHPSVWGQGGKTQSPSDGQITTDHSINAQKKVEEDICVISFLTCRVAGTGLGPQAMVRMITGCTVGSASSMEQYSDLAMFLFPSPISFFFSQFTPQLGTRHCAFISLCEAKPASWALPCLHCLQMKKGRL